MTYEYKFVRIELRFPFMGLPEPAQDYHQVINQHARQGWRLAQVFAPPLSPYGGRANYFELIFERPTGGDTGGS